ncbi:MAG: hypothetical protein ACRDXX_00390 [Stackebrandtia sp.]
MRSQRAKKADLIGDLVGADTVDGDVVWKAGSAQPVKAMMRVS